MSVQIFSEETLIEVMSFIPYRKKKQNTKINAGCGYFVQNIFLDDRTLEY